MNYVRRSSNHPKRRRNRSSSPSAQSTIQQPFEPAVESSEHVTDENGSAPCSNKIERGGESLVSMPMERLKTHQATRQQTNYPRQQIR